MKRFKIKLGIQTLQTLLVCVALSLICAGCNAKVPKKSASMYEMIDSVMRTEIGDSLCSIMLEAKRIDAEHYCPRKSVNILGSDIL